MSILAIIASQLATTNKLSITSFKNITNKPSKKATKFSNYLKIVNLIAIVSKKLDNRLTFRRQTYIIIPILLNSKKSSKLVYIDIGYRVSLVNQIQRIK